MGDLVHRSKVHIVPEQPSVKQAFVEPFPQPIRTGMHGGVKAWYGRRSKRNFRPPSIMSSPPLALE